MEEFEIQANAIDSTAIILKVTGALHTQNAERLRAEFDRHLNAGYRAFILDLAHMEAIDSLGVGVLFSMVKILQPMSGAVRIFGPSQNVKIIFEMTRINQCIAVSATLNDALQGLRRGTAVPTTH